MRVKCGGVLAKKLYLLLRLLASLVNSLTTLPSTFGELLILVFNLCMKPVEDGKNSTLQLFRCLVMLIRNTLPHCKYNSCKLAKFLRTCMTYLSVRPDILEHTSNTTERLIEVMPLLKRIFYGLHIYQ